MMSPPRRPPCSTSCSTGRWCDKPSGMATDVEHRIGPVEGGRIHLVEQGSGPVVLLVHGFPESWYSWRHQLPELAAAGYRAVAIDVRGYGRSSRPSAVADYRMLNLVGDVVGLLEALGSPRAALVGHDWGAPIVWTSALLRPDLFWGVAGLSVPYRARGETRPLATMRAMAGDDEFSSEPRQGSAPHRSL